jgi:hypothetical protein
MKKIYLTAIVGAYVYTLYMTITMFLVPAFKTYFGLYGVAGTFLLWAALTACGYACGYFFVKVLQSPEEEFTNDHS